MKKYKLRDDICIKLCEDGFIRVYKKDLYVQEKMYVLYVISKIQAVILLLFKGGLEIALVEKYISDIYEVAEIKAHIMVENIMMRYSGLLEGCEDKEENIICVDAEIKKILSKTVKKPNELRTNFIRSEVPESMVVFIDDICSSNCIYCKVDSGYTTSEPHFMEMSVIDRVVEECAKYKIQDIELTGGDPLLHPEFYNILEVFNNRGLAVSFSTKCPISKENLKKIKRCNISLFQISIDSIEIKEFIKLTGTTCAYLDKLLKTIKEAIAMGISIRIKSVITKINILQMADMIKELHKIGVNEFVLQQLSCGDRKFGEELMPTRSDYMTLEHALSEFINDKDIHIVKAYDVEFIFSNREQQKYFRQECMAGRTGMVIQIDGSYAYCGQSFNKQLRFLNIKDIGLLEAWNSEELRNMISPARELFIGTKCFECKDFDMCIRRRCYLRTLKKWGHLYDVDTLCPYYDDEV